ncbi:hypothetical protein ADK82_07815, partial [Streptomyces sp. NRRL S-4]
MAGGGAPQPRYGGGHHLPGLLHPDILCSRQTYPYFDGTPLFAFGHGLGYADFSYSALRTEVDG